MRNLRMLFLGIGFITGLGVEAQNVASTATLTSGGLQAGTLGIRSTYYGYQSGKAITSTGSDNFFFGHGAGSNTTGSYNAFFGGVYNIIAGSRNSFFGSSVGPYSDGSDNVAMGYQSLNYNSSGVNKTTALGAFAGAYSSGSENVLIGYYAGTGKSGSNNVFIGNNTGESSSNKLHIDNAATTTPLIWGDFALDQVKLNGKTGIGLGTAAFPTLASGINVSTYKLFVKGGILAEEVRVTLSTAWADYVFAQDYALKPLHEVEQFITANGHLPNVPSAKQVKEEGIELGDMAKIQQEKIEELTLYLIQQNKEIEAMKAQLKALTDKK